MGEIRLKKTAINVFDTKLNSRVGRVFTQKTRNENLKQEKILLKV